MIRQPQRNFQYGSLGSNHMSLFSATGAPAVRYHPGRSTDKENMKHEWDILQGVEAKADDGMCRKSAVLGRAPNYYWR